MSCTRISFVGGLKCQDAIKYEAFCRRTEPHFDDELREMDGASEYLEVLMSTHPYEVPIMFAVKDNEIHAYMRDGSYVRWDNDPHKCVMLRNVTMPMERLVQPEVEMGDRGAVALLYPEAGDLKPGSRLIVLHCAHVIDHCAPGEVNVRFAYEREYVHGGTDQGMSSYRQKLLHEDRQYEILDSHVRIRFEPRGSVYVQSTLCPASSPLDFPPAPFFESGDIIVTRDKRQEKRGWLLFCKREREGGYKLVGPDDEILYDETEIPRAGCRGFAMVMTKSQEEFLERYKREARELLGDKGKPKPYREVRREIFARLKASGLWDKKKT